MTGRQLYDKLYRRFHRFLRLKEAAAGIDGFATRSLSTSGAAAATPTSSRENATNSSLPSAMSGSEERGLGVGEAGSAEAGEEDDFAGRPCMGTSEDKECPESVRATSMWVAAGKVNRWGFRCDVELYRSINRVYPIWFCVKFGGKRG